MRLEEAIEISIELWTWLAETGEEFKYRWPGWKKYGRMLFGCSLCEYTERKRGGCEDCPYYKMFGHCNGIDTAFFMWGDSETVETRKKYAGLFLEQLKQL